MADITEFLLSGGNTLREALDCMDATGVGIVIIVDSNKKMKGVATIGDIRRAIMKGTSLDAHLNTITNKNPIVAKVGMAKEELISLASGTNGIVPVTNAQGEVVDIFIASPAMREYDVEKSIVGRTASIRNAMQKIDASGYGIALVVDDSRKLLGVVTHKDIRDAILKGMDADDPITGAMNSNPIVGNVTMDQEKLAILNTTNKHIKIPLVNDEGAVVSLVQAPIKEDERHIFISAANPIERHVSSVLITGGAGYLGSVLSRMLLDKGYQVTVLDRLIFGDESVRDLISHPRFRLIKGDVRHIDTIASAVKDVDAVIHLAGIVGDPACAKSPMKTIEQNYLATIALANVCKYHQINRFIFASSCSVYGQADSLLTEESALSPVSLYARDKIKSENGILSLMDENFSPTILRMGTLYGFSHRPRFDLVVNIMTAKAVKEGKVTVFGGDQWRPMLHVIDAAEAYIKVLEAPLQKVRGQIFNVGNEAENYRIIELGKKVHELIPDSILEVSEKAVDKRDYRVSFRKIEKNLGFRPLHRIGDGVREIAAAFAEGKVKDYKEPRYHNHLALHDAE